MIELRDLKIGDRVVCHDAPNGGRVFKGIVEDIDITGPETGTAYIRVHPRIKESPWFVRYDNDRKKWGGNGYDGELFFEKDFKMPEPKLKVKSKY